jgi:glutamate 5-kinase
MNNQHRINLLKNVKRVVIKIGRGVLGLPDGGLDAETINRLVDDICTLTADSRYEAIIVSSGAVMGGRNLLGLPRGKLAIPQKQASAAVGQVVLMKHYEEFFGKRGRKIAQILLTHGDIEDRARYMNVRSAMKTLLEMGVIPIINENDSTAVEELKFGDNDTLSAKITSVMDADLLLILSDVDGMFDGDPRKNSSARLIEDVPVIDARILSMAGDSSTASGTGGMGAKVIAAQVASAYGIPTWIIGGKTEGAILGALREGRGGTFFHPQENRLSARHHWISHILKSQGRITVDAGAKKAILEKGKSLLPSGIVDVSGAFQDGDAVTIADGNNEVFAKALVNYDSAELKLISGKKTAEIETILGYKKTDEVIHRDNLVFMAIAAL